ncbi:VanZ family protein [Gorillibacterium massiliense]|uniref:VanZ family protein n=1 Tax=Gorillibacterium massiliense TaxID=1280390 RepID=UPI0004B8965A|nr:VanZ family protein [Gorillibacterium massiliense]
MEWNVVSMNRKAIVWLLVCLGWMAIIFNSSSQPYEKQDLRPKLHSWISEDFVKKYFSHVVFDYAGSEVSIRAKGVPGFVEFFIRKGAHFSVYAALSLSFLMFFRSLKVYRWKGFLFAVAASLLYAISDEIHQSFTADRTPLVQDVVVDFVGAVVGAAILSFILRKKKDKDRLVSS